MAEAILKIESEKRPSLEEAQKAVGGFVELVTTTQGQLLVNEEGILEGLPHNEKASEVAGIPICGNALLLKYKAQWD